MPVERTWHRPTGMMLRPLAAASGLALAGVLLMAAPAPSRAFGIGMLVVGALLFVLAWWPFVRFMFLARIGMQNRAVSRLTGFAVLGAPEPEPPFTPSSPRRLFGWRVTRGSLPSCQVWVFRRPAKDRVRMVVLLGSSMSEGEPAVDHAKLRLKRWIERHGRRPGPG